MKIVIKISEDFSKTPVGRTDNDGPNNGARFASIFLFPKLTSSEYDIVEVNLDGLDGVGCSFWESAFGGLRVLCETDPTWLHEKLVITGESQALINLIWSIIDGTYDAKKITVTSTPRGFSVVKFEDKYHKKCSIQISSGAGDEYSIWFGHDELGMVGRTSGQVGWSPVSSEDIEKSLGLIETSWNSRMLLTQSDVKRLLPMLTKFAETGRLS